MDLLGITSVAIKDVRCVSLVLLEAYERILKLNYPARGESEKNGGKGRDEEVELFRNKFAGSQADRPDRAMKEEVEAKKVTKKSGSQQSWRLQELASYSLNFS
ncbi:hypothetical protein Tco_1548500 [Tanacetum coccineum]